MKLRLIVWFLIVTGYLFRIGLAVRRWIPAVAFGGRWDIGACLVRSQVTYCLLDPGMHDTNIALGGECAGDGTWLVVEGVRVCLGPVIVYWPHDVAP